jgi:hypothetical protein
MYNYPFKIDEETLGYISGFDTDKWSDVIHLILENKPIPFNISFTERNIDIRIQELYSALLKYNLRNVDHFRSAIVRLLIEHYDNEFLVEKSYYLILSIEFIKPSRYFQQLSSLLIRTSINNPNFKNISYKGIVLNHLFFDAIFQFDTDVDSNLFKIFWEDRHSLQLASYYQVVMRYLLFKEKNLVCEFLDCSLNFIDAKDMKETLLDVLQEGVYYNKTFKFIINWVLNSNNKESDNFKLFQIYLYNEWLNKEYFKSKLKDIHYYDLIMCLIYVDRRLDEWNDIFVIIATKYEHYQKEIYVNLFRRISLYWISIDQKNDLIDNVWDSLPDSNSKKKFQKAIEQAWEEANCSESEKESLKQAI